MKAKRGSIELARQLCFEIAGPTDEDDITGSGYGSVDVAEILSAEVVRLRGLLMQSDTEGATGTGYGGLAASDGVEGTSKRQSIP
jgi:hypothetical protein